MTLFLLVHGFSLFNPVYAETGQLAVDNNAVENRIDNMFKLLNESSAAKQVINSTHSEANKKRQEALDLYQLARDKFKIGLNEESSKLLSQSAKLMFEAIKLSTPTSMTDDKNIIDYEKRKKSVIALKEAFIRISDENKETETKQKVGAQLDRLVSKADSLLKKGNSHQARIEIDKAYHLLKVSIDSIRSGQTLTRSLNFATKEEEFDYEINRNDTHNLLVSLLVEEQKQSEIVNKNINNFIDQANELRQQAELNAKYKSYEKAIELLEQSTKQLVRAIRSAGIFIPG